MAIKVRPGESLESALKRFKKEMLKSDIMKDMRKHEYYIPPSEKRRLKDAEALKRLKKKAAKSKMY